MNGIYIEKYIYIYIDIYWKISKLFIVESCPIPQFIV